MSDARDLVDALSLLSRWQGDALNRNLHVADPLFEATETFLAGFGVSVEYNPAMNRVERRGWPLKSQASFPRRSSLSQAVDE